MAETTHLMTIGRFSALSRLSVRMLRHYDTHGVLVPVDVDPGSGYRRYAPSQLTDAADLRKLRDVGFGVSTIGALLAARGTPTWPTALQLQRETLAEELRAVQERLTLITHMLDEGDHTMPITVRRTAVPAMTVVALRGTVPTYADERQLWDRMMPLLHAQTITPTGPCGVIEHDNEYTEHDVDLSIFFPVAPDTQVEAPLTVLELPQRDCLVAEVHGSYDRISEAHDLITARIAAENLAVGDENSIAGSAFNRYLTTPDQVDESKLVTEVCQPLA